MNHANLAKSKRLPKPRHSFHASDIKKSVKLQRVLKYVKEHRGCTGLEIDKACKVRNAAQWVSALRLERNGGHDIKCHFSHTTAEGGRVWKNFYRAVK